MCHDSVLGLFVPRDGRVKVKKTYYSYTAQPHGTVSKTEEMKDKRPFEREIILTLTF